MTSAWALACCPGTTAGSSGGSPEAAPAEHPRSCCSPSSGAVALDASKNSQLSAVSVTCPSPSCNRSDLRARISGKGGRSVGEALPVREDHRRAPRSRCAPGIGQGQPRPTADKGSCTLGILATARVTEWLRGANESPRPAAKEKFQAHPPGRTCAVLIRVLVCVAGALALLRWFDGDLLWCAALPRHPWLFGPRSKLSSWTCFGQVGAHST